MHDPAIIDEVIVKMPNLRVLYCQNNEFIKKVPNYRKTTIVKIPTLMYLDDRPVFPEDRRRAEAFARGGLPEERAEMKLIKKEKEDKHWANHEAFNEMIKKARANKTKVTEEEAQELESQKGEKKATMKEMMAKAKKDKEDANKRGEFPISENEIKHAKDIWQMGKELAD